MIQERDGIKICVFYRVRAISISRHVSDYALVGAMQGRVLTARTIDDVGRLTSAPTDAFVALASRALYLRPFAPTERQNRREISVSNIRIDPLHQ